MASMAVVEQSFVACRNILGLSKSYSPELLEAACAQVNACGALPSYTGCKNRILSIRAAAARDRASCAPDDMPTDGGEPVDRAKSAGRTRGADAYRRGGGDAC